MTAREGPDVTARSVLAHTLLGATEAPRETLLLVHGIMGSRRNWRSFAQRLVAGRPGLRVAIADLRGHGDSHGLPGAPTVATCADDLMRLDAHLRQGDAAASGLGVTALVGHSFGGKVCVDAAARWPTQLRQVWVLDAPLGPRAEAAGTSDVEAVIAAVARLKMPVAQRGDAAETLKNQGFSPALADWMTTNLRPEEDGFVWRFDLDVVAALLVDYFARDLWPSFSLPRPGVKQRMVRGARSDRWRPADLARLAALQRAGRARDLVLTDAGHWLHADNPTGLLALMLADL